LTVIHPGAASAARRWPSDRWAEVAAHERAAGRQVVVSGSAYERELCAKVCAAAGLSTSANLAGRTSLTELAALVAAAEVVCSGDTGVAHLASAYGRRSVVLFGPTSPSAWGPPRSPQHEVLWAGRCGNPHGRRVDPGLRRLTVRDVLDALARQRRSCQISPVSS
jgi:ADP-heptose:LPS heptosyltransferase